MTRIYILAYLLGGRINIETFNTRKDLADFKRKLRAEFCHLGNKNFAECDVTVE